MNTINDIITKIALDNLGQEEIRGNLGFKDPEFERRMQAVGFKKGHAWCSYYAELVWKLAYQQYDATMNDTLDKLFSASAVQTWKNFKKAIEFETTLVPDEGSLVVWQTYKNGTPHWTGHIGIVIKYDQESDSLITVEGNTNDDGSREGYKVAKKRRKNMYRKTKTGLRLLGFITPLD
jgi:hypothetical protein